MSKIRINQSGHKSLGHWQLVFLVRQDFMRNQTGWYAAQIGIIKITSKPEEGHVLGRGNYKGFLLQFRFLVPIARGL
jgi:hypothetical protein